jgi:hypothetical protein
MALGTSNLAEFEMQTLASCLSGHRAAELSSHLARVRKLELKTASEAYLAALDRPCSRASVVTAPVRDRVATRVGLRRELGSCKLVRSRSRGLRASGASRSTEEVKKLPA